MRDWHAWVRERLHLNGIRPEHERDVIDDLATLLDEAYREAITRGLSEDDALAAAEAHVPDWPSLAKQIAESRRLALPALARLETRAADADVDGTRGAGFLTGLVQDLRRAVKEVGRSWQTTAAVLAMVALGAGAGSVAVGVMTTLLTNPLNIAEPDRVVVYPDAFASLSGGPLTYPEDVVDYKAMVPGVSHMAIYSRHDGGVNLVADRRAIRVRGAEVSAEFFDTLGLPMSFGRSFHKDDMRPGQNRVVVLGHELFRQLYGESRDLTDRTVRLNDITFTVIGVAPGGMRFPRQSQFWVPWSADSVFTGPAISYMVFGRLEAGLSLVQARDSFVAFAAEAGRQTPGSWPTRRDLSVISLADEVIGPTEFIFQILDVALFLIWIAAAANIAVMLKARAEARRAEFWTRRALGATPLHFIRQFAAEGLLLATASGVCGAAAAVSSLQVIGRILPDGYGGAPALSPADPTMWLCAALSLLTGVLAVVPGLRVALRHSAGPAPEARRATSRVASSSFRLPVVVQTLAAMVLVTGTSVFAQSLVRLQNTDLGFDPTGVTVASMTVPSGRVAGEASATGVRQMSAYSETINRVEVLPGVVAVGATSALPLSGTDVIGLLYSVVGAPAPAGFRNRFALTTSVTEGYFAAIGLETVAGRTFSDRDTETSIPVVIVNSTLASRYGGPDAILGRQIELPGREIPTTVIGVVADARLLGLQTDPDQQIFLPHCQEPGRLSTLVVRAEAGAASLPAAIRQVVADVDPTLAVFDARPFEEVVRASTALQRRAFTILGIFTVIALSLAATGVFAALSHYVAARQRDIGIRMALGASQADVAVIVIGRGAALTVAGSAAGALLAFWGLRYLSASQFGVLSASPLDYALGAVALLAIAVAACLPATMTALRVDPVALLRRDT